MRNRDRKLQTCATINSQIRDTSFAREQEHSPLVEPRIGGCLNIQYPLQRVVVGDDCQIGSINIMSEFHKTPV